MVANVLFSTKRTLKECWLESGEWPAFGHSRSPGPKIGYFRFRRTAVIDALL